MKLLFSFLFLLFVSFSSIALQTGSLTVSYRGSSYVFTSNFAGKIFHFGDNYRLYGQIYIDKNYYEFDYADFLDRGQWSDSGTFSLQGTTTTTHGIQIVSDIKIINVPTWTSKNPFTIDLVTGRNYSVSLANFSGGGTMSYAYTGLSDSNLVMSFSGSTALMNLMASGSTRQVQFYINAQNEAGKSANIPIILYVSGFGGLPASYDFNCLTDYNVTAGQTVTINLSTTKPATYDAILPSYLTLSGSTITGTIPSYLSGVVTFDVSARSTEFGKISKAFNIVVSSKTPVVADPEDVNTKYEIDKTGFAKNSLDRLSSIDNTLEQLNLGQQNMEMLLDDIDYQTKDLNTNIKQMNSTLNSSINNVYSAVTTGNTKLDTLNATLSTNSSKIDSTNSKLDTSNSKLDSLKTSIDNQNTNLSSKLDTVNNSIKNITFGGTVQANISPNVFDATNTRLDDLKSRSDITNSKLSDIKSILSADGKSVATGAFDVGDGTKPSVLSPDFDGNFSVFRSFLNTRHDTQAPVLVIPLHALSDRLQDHELNFGKGVLYDTVKIFRLAELGGLVLLCLVWVFRIIRSFEY